MTTCVICGAEFTPRSGSGGDPQIYCGEPCRSAAYLPVGRAYQRRYYAEHADQVNAYARSYYRANRDAILARRRAYYAAHPEISRDYRAGHREERMKELRERYHAQPPVVYAWFAPAGTAEYVGRGTLARSQTHARTATRKPWWTPEHLVISMTCDSEWQAMEMEGRWGGRYLPRHNKEGYRHAGGKAVAA